jgi:hypothetical protein
MNFGRFVGARLPVFFVLAMAIAFHRFAEVSIGIAVALIFRVLWPEGEIAAPGKT